MSVGNMRLLAALLIAALGVAVGSPAVAKDPYVYGPAPDWLRYRELGAAAVRAALPDPDAWQIEWPNGYYQAGWRHNGGPVQGYVTCGVARATRPVVKYHLLTRFVIVIDRDVVKRVDISSRESNSLVNVLCNIVVEKGLMPPATMMTKPTDLTSQAQGMTIRPMPEGAYVSAVVAGSAAASAGVTAGMVITTVNGIALAGTGPEMTKLLAVDVPLLTLGTAVGTQLTIRSGR